MKDPLIENPEEFHLITRHLVMPNELNPNHTIFGGQLLAWLDVDLYLYLTEKVRDKYMVTYSMDKVYFKNPAYLGEIIEVHGAIKKIQRTRISVLGKAIAVDPETQARRVIIECEISYVAIDDNGKPRPAFEKYL